MARKRIPMRAHTFRCEDDMWTAANDAADLFNEDMSEVIRRALRGYITRAERAKAEGVDPSQVPVTADA